MSLIVLSRILAALVAGMLAFAYVLNDVTPESLPWLKHEQSLTTEAEGTFQDIERTTKEEGRQTHMVDR
jgi:hypothetical protein